VRFTNLNLLPVSSCDVGDCPASFFFDAFSFDLLPEDLKGREVLDDQQCTEEGEKHNYDMNIQQKR